MSRKKKASASLQFPPNAIVGSLGDFARLMSAGTEVPTEFYFAASLTIFGNQCSGGLTLKLPMSVQPRLFTVLLGESYAVKKSTALKRTVEFFDSVWSDKLDGAAPASCQRPKFLWGAGSAEGLSRCLGENNHAILCYDEMRSLIDKSKAQGSVLLSMAASLFELNNWDNSTKHSSVSVRDAHLSIVGCCTTDTYAAMWTSEAIAIGLPNRLFVVLADRSEKVSWPTLPDENELDKIRERIKAQVARLPLALDIEPDARARWDQWYLELSPSIHARRLDTIGFRLMGLVAVTTDKSSIDMETIETVISILDYELQVRTLTDPIDADNRVAHLEERIRRQLKAHVSLSPRELKQHTNANRDGLWAFQRAIDNLRSAGELSFDTSNAVYRWA
jgi:hypothetical protein